MQKTDWEQKYSALKCLHDDISNHKIQNSKNAIFYEWIQRKLQADIWDETNRVYKLKEGVY